MLKKLKFSLKIDNSIYSSEQILEMFKDYDIKIRFVYLNNTHYGINVNRDDEFNINKILDDNKIDNKSFSTFSYLLLTEEEEEIYKNKINKIKKISLIELFFSFINIFINFFMKKTHKKDCFLFV
jgi:hypothetical protein